MLIYSREAQTPKPVVGYSQGARRKTGRVIYHFVLQVCVVPLPCTIALVPMPLYLDKFQKQFPANIVRNQKYNVFTFLPIVLYEQFKFFFNLYFLLVALSQFVPQLRIG